MELGTAENAERRPAFRRFLRGVVEAGEYADRVMFGSDRVLWPGLLEVAVSGIEEATFLTKAQKRGIFDENAAPSLRLWPEATARHHAATAPQVVVVAGRVDAPIGGPPARAGEPHAERRGDGTRDLVLDGEHVAHRPLERLAPQPCAVGAAREFGDHPPPAARAAHAPGAHRVGTGRLRHPPRILAAPLARESGSAGGDAQQAVALQHADELLGHPVHSGRHPPNRRSGSRTAAPSRPGGATAPPRGRRGAAVPPRRSHRPAARAAAPARPTTQRDRAIGLDASPADGSRSGRERDHTLVLPRHIPVRLPVRRRARAGAGRAGLRAA